MNSSRPYLLRAIYEWIIDNQSTPYIIVDAMIPDVKVPNCFVKNGEIVLNIESQAIGCLRMGNDAVEFDARFSGISHHIFIPVRAIKAIYAFENSYGIMFTEDKHENHDNDSNSDKMLFSPNTNSRTTIGALAQKKRLPNFKIVK